LLVNAFFHRRQLTTEQRQKIPRRDASSIAADRKRIASSVKDFTVNPAAPVGDPSPDEQPRLGRDNTTRCLRQRPPWVPIRSQPRRRLPPHGGLFARR
jgi:hypothetical protein